MYFNYLSEMFRPLRLFRSGAPAHEGELRAVGVALDSIYKKLEEAEWETVPLLSQNWGMQQYKSLFSLKPSHLLPEQWGPALAALLYIGTGGSSKQALAGSIGACGVNAVIEETETPALLEVTFPQSAGIIGNFEEASRVIEGILPAHVEINYQFRFISWIDWERLYPTFAYLESLGLTWSELETYQLQ